MEPITFILWIWLTWGVGRVWLRDTPAAAPADEVAGETARKAADPGGDVQARARWRERVAERVRRLIDAADTNAERVRRTDWGNAGWWLRVLLAAGWMPLHDVVHGARWAKAKTGRRRTSEDIPDPAEPDAPDVDGDAGGDRTGEREHDGPDETGGRGRRHRRDSRPRDPDDPGTEYEVEVIRTTPNTPEQGQLPRPVRQLEAAGDDAPPPEPTPTDTSTDEGNSDMAGQYVAIPGATSPATRGGYSPATSTGNGDTHADAKEFARQIIQAMERTADPVAQAAEMLRVCVLAAWEKVDRLQAVGIGGKVLEGWGDAVILFEAAKQTSLTLAAQVAEARAAAAQARGRQVAIGDRVEDAVVAAGKSAANNTSYYGK